MHDNEIEQLRQEDLAREARARLTMPGLIPPRPDLAATYWVQSAGTIQLAEWLTHRRWVICGLVYSPESAAERGYTFATIAGTECRHPVPGPAALLRMHAPDGEMVKAVLSGLSLGVRIEDIITDVLKEAMKP